VVPNQKVIESLAKQYGLQNYSFDQLCKNNKIQNCVSIAIKAYGKQNGLSKREIPAKIKLCSEQWTPDNGLLTAALKLKRVIILNNYKKEVMEMFSDDINNNI
jgi:long-chain acyl-CoA synthetase